MTILKVEKNCLRFANPAEAIRGRHSEAWRLRCVEAQKLEGSYMLILATSWRTSNKYVHVKAVIFEHT